MNAPLYINKVGGWALDIVASLWGDVIIDDNKFSELNQRVLNEVQFPCIIFAQYDFGILAIDCNDSDTYEVDDKRIAIYIKLQFNPNHHYKQKVYPFIFVPQKSSFMVELENYRFQYKQAHKFYPAWGRFIAVSLDRFHISHEMERLGLSGGSYVTTEEGYQDHYLDPIKPRQRMEFSEYLSHMCKSIAVIDARGFGDMTHRTIESFGVGIPLIRPRLTVQTIDPILPGVHYLDCGHKGEYLKDCVEAVRNGNLRHSLINNGLNWFNKNCIPSGMQYHLSNILGQHQTTKKRVVITVPNPQVVKEPKLSMLVGLYKDRSDSRMHEMVETLAFNIANPTIEKIYVFWEDETSLEEAVKIIPQLKHGKVSLIRHGKRLLFADLFRFANTTLLNKRVIIANNDVYFGELSKLDNYDLQGHILNLSRWDVNTWDVPKYMDCDASQDAWIFQTPINLDPQFHLGWWGCDGRMNYEANEAELLVSNPSYEIFVYHNHTSGVRNYDSLVQNVPGGMGIPPSKLVWPKRVTPVRLTVPAKVEFHCNELYNTRKLIDGMSSHINIFRPFLNVPSELYGLQYTQVVAWKDSPISIKCTHDGTIYIMLERNWNNGMQPFLTKIGAVATTIEPETIDTKFEVWSLEMSKQQDITLPRQAIVVAESLTRV